MKTLVSESRFQRSNRSESFLEEITRKQLCRNLCIFDKAEQIRKNYKKTPVLEEVLFVLKICYFEISQISLFIWAIPMKNFAFSFFAF